MAAGGRREIARGRKPAPHRLKAVPPAGAGFAARVRRMVLSIPRGRVATYGQIAALAGRPRAARQVARALHHGGGLPWHRVVAAGGRIALPGEAGWEQRLRLEREGVRFRGRRVQMAGHQWRRGGTRGAGNGADLHHGDP